MKISNITECGSNNILRWAITNGADIRQDRQIQTFINDETFYSVDIEDVNFLELYRLTQTYREKLRIMDEKKACIPPRSDLIKLFPGSYKFKDKEEKEREVALYEIVEQCCQKFIDIALQMNTDNDVIRPESVRLFIPMLCRKYNIQIPVGFMELASMMQMNDDCARIFNEKYPETLDIIINDENCNVKNMLLLALMKETSIVRYDKHYEDLIKIIKYSPLKKCTNQDLYKFRLSGFFKYDNISRSEVRCTMFNPNRDAMKFSMKRMARLNTPLKVEFIVQLPLQYMMMVLNSYSRDELDISYESSISSIIEGNLQFNDFITHSYDENTEDPEELQLIKDHNNAIELYKNRISEANTNMLSMIPVLVSNECDIDITSMFAMLPSLYTGKAIFTLDAEKVDLYTNHYDATIAKMFREMADMVKSVQSDISKYK